jgi:hypothetical protein
MQRNASHATDDPVPADGVAAFIEQLDALARRRPRSDPRLPTMVVTGAHADELVEGYAARLIVDGRPSVPHVLLDCLRARPGSAAPTVSDADARLLDRVADALGQSLPGGLRGMHGGRGLRLPRYRTLRHVLDATTPAATEPERRRQLRDALYAHRRELGAPAGWLDPLAAWLDKVGIGPVSGALVARPLVGASRAVFGMRLGVSRRFTWFRKEMATVTGVRRSFLGAGLRLTIGGDERANATLVQRVLTLALLHDLQAATRTSVLSPMRRRRVTPFVVLLLHVTAGSLAHRFLDALAALGDDDLRRHTVLVLATPAADGDSDGKGDGEGEDHPGDALLPPGTPAYGPHEAATALAPLAERGVPLPARTIRVDVPGPPGGADEQWLQIHRVVQPMPVAGAVAIPLLVALGLVVAVTAVVMGLVDGDGPSRCPEEVGGEMIGVGDPSDGCSFFPGADDTATPVDDAMVDAEEAIARENTTVLSSGEPYSSEVFFAPLTIPPGQGRQGENALNQLRGTALAQQRDNRAAVADPKRVMTRVLLANPGDRFVHGVEVARQIVERAADDETIIGVVGIGQSRTASRDAVHLLGDHRVPVVAGPVTGDEMVTASSHYYQVSPRNKRVASVLVDFSSHTAIVPTDDGPVVPEGAVIVMDHSDEYSRNLADDLYNASTRARRPTRSIVTYPIEDPGAPVPDPPADAPEPVRVGSSDELAQAVCSSLEPNDIVFYTSRSQQFVSLLQSMHDDNDCPDAFTVVGGSALTKIVEDPSNPLAQYGVSLYYAAFASSGEEFNRAGREFMGLYRAAYGDDVVAPDISDGAVAYDAFNALQRTANYAVENDLPISADTSAAALGGAQIPFDGASGYIALGNGSVGRENPRVPPLKPVLVLPAGDAPRGNNLACGRFAADDERTTWAPGRGPDTFDCPTVD